MATGSSTTTIGLDVAPSRRVSNKPNRDFNSIPSKNTRLTNIIHRGILIYVNPKGDCNCKPKMYITNVQLTKNENTVCYIKVYGRLRLTNKVLSHS